MGNNTLSRQALPVAVSWDSATRQAVVVASTAAPQADGVALVHTRDAIRWPSRPLPVFVNHDAHPREFVGSVTALELGREKGVTALIATVQLADSEAGRLAEPMVASGAARWSIRARIHNLERGPAGSDFDRATDWEPVELSLVGIGMDAAAVTRSADFHNIKKQDNSMTIDNIEQTPTVERIERSRCAAILDAARKLQVSDDLAHQLIEDGTELSAARMALIDARSAAERLAPGGHERTEVQPPNQQQSELAALVQRAWDGRNAEPLWLSLRSMGHRGSNGVEVLRGALSTSDLPLMLTGAGNRQLLAQFAAAPAGVRMAAAVRQLADYRSASTLDVGLVGKAAAIKEGGEIKFSSASEQSASYKPTRHGLGLSFTPESIANDDLNGLDRAIGELGSAMLEAEAVALAALLEGNALGELAPDGKRLFHADHVNTVVGPLSISSLGSAVAKLRRQTTIGGRYLYQEPGAIVCSPDIELTVRQLLSDTLQATDPVDVNPWRSLEVAVDPQLGATYVYLLPSGNRLPLELGRLSPAPILESETDFTTGMYRVKSEHAFGCAVVDHRPIVRMTVAGA